MIKTILVPATGDSSDAATLAAALTIARAFAAHIDVLHVRIDPLDAALAISPDPGGAALIASLTDRIARDAAEQEAAAKQLFDDFCAGEKVSLRDAPAPGQEVAASAEWHVETGNDNRSVAAHGMFADLIVAARGAEHDVTNRSVLETALIETGCPLLIPAGEAARSIIGGTAAIAWKATPQAARAVAAAMPLLVRAAEIIVMTVDEGDGAGDSGVGADRLLRHLAWHGLRATIDRLRSEDQDPADALLSAAGRKAELLVMGGYGHSRMREWIFGGFTQRVLADAPLPVLLAH